MKKLSVKTILRGFSAFALCAALGMGSALAYNGDPELAYTNSDPTHITTSDASLSTDPETVTVSAPPPVGALASDRLTQLKTGEVVPRTVAKSASLAADSTIRSNSRNLGSFRLSFYCPCEKCNGRTDKKTKMGTEMVEGRTIAVDTSVIPLGSRVYIDGYGLFIAEDIGGAIKENKIDIAVSDHDHAYELGVDNATVYLIA
ncbi:MAG: 3D domain-containing protein [Butyricicoccus pullicaecorum]|nr:3D domain-containing protein [Butyricicoccus pullicaecorum]MDO4668874.1 3D domain-containing protein [Butyricicoccus pullicaecorum]